MRKSFIMSIVICGLLVISGSAWSYTVDGGATDVGGLDTLISKADLGSSGDATELAWVQGVIPVATWATKYTDANELGNWNWKQTNDAGVVALNLSTAPAYFLIKTGNLKISPVNFEHFLFGNNTDIAWAVVSLSDFGSADAAVGKFSHVVEFNGSPGTSVPEPGTLLLLGLGLIGLVGVARRRTK